LSPDLSYTIRSLREDELEDMLELTSLSYNSSVEAFRGIYEKDPFYSFELTRVAEYKGSLISYMRAAPRTIWIGSSRVKMGGIAEVCTHPRYRKMGIATRLLRDIILLMKDSGYPVSMLYGNPAFYGKIGWERCSIVHELRVSRASLPPPSGDRLREYEDRDLPGVMSLYDGTYSGRSCAMVRNSLHWTGRVLRRTKVKVLDDGKAYAGVELRYRNEGEYSRKVLYVQEAGYVDQDAAHGLVSALADLGEFDLLEYHGVPGDAMLSALSIPGASINIGWGGMFRVNDAWATLNSLPEPVQAGGSLVLRVRDGVVGQNNGQFTLHSRGDGMEVERGGGAREWIELDIGALSQLVPGLFTPSQLALRGRIGYSSARALEIGDGIFPRRHPFQPTIDHF